MWSVWLTMWLFRIGISNCCTGFLLLGILGRHRRQFTLTNRCSDPWVLLAALIRIGPLFKTVVELMGWESERCLLQADSWHKYGLLRHHWRAMWLPSANTLMFLKENDVSGQKYSVSLLLQSRALTNFSLTLGRVLVAWILFHRPSFPQPRIVRASLSIFRLRRSISIDAHRLGAVEAEAPSHLFLCSNPLDNGYIRWIFLGETKK